MRKLLIYASILIILAFAYVAFIFLRPAIHKGSKDGQYIYIRTGENMDELKQDLREQGYVNGMGFELVCRVLGFKNPKPGRYKVKDGMSLLSLVRMLRNGSQSIVKVVIIKERTPALFAGKFGKGRKYDSEFDSLQMIRFLTNNDSLSKYGLDSNSVMAAVIPLTYEMNWNNSPGRLFKQFDAAYRSFWNEERKQKSQELGLEPFAVATLASIVEEETNIKEDKYNIASTYLNRIKQGMKLQADPTVKYALKDFSIKRVLHKHLEVNSPYNTYQHTGLPPGPICTPSIETVDAVLNAPVTDYLYFVASDKFDGSSVFTSKYEDHQKYAKLYQQALDRRYDSILKAKALK